MLVFLRSLTWFSSAALAAWFFFVRFETNQRMCEKSGLEKPSLQTKNAVTIDDNLLRS